MRQYMGNKCRFQTVSSMEKEAHRNAECGIAGDDKRTTTAAVGKICYLTLSREQPNSRPAMRLGGQAVAVWLAPQKARSSKKGGTEKPRCPFSCCRPPGGAICQRS